MLIPLLHFIQTTRMWNILHIKPFHRTCSHRCVWYNKQQNVDIHIHVNCNCPQNKSSSVIVLLIRCSCCTQLVTFGCIYAETCVTIACIGVSAVGLIPSLTAQRDPFFEQNVLVYIYTSILRPLWKSSHRWGDSSMLSIYGEFLFIC